jgi:hypothetical protein
MTGMDADVGGSKETVKFGDKGTDKIAGAGPASNGSTSFPGSKGQGHIRESEGSTGS